MQSPCLVTNSSVLSPRREELRTCCPISLPASHCELDDKVVASPPGGTRIIRGAGGWDSKAEAASKQDHGRWSRSFRGSTGCGATFHLVPVCLEVSSAGTSTTGCFSPGRLNVGVVYPGPDPVHLNSHRHGQYHSVGSFPMRFQSLVVRFLNPDFVTWFKARGLWEEQTHKPDTWQSGLLLDPVEGFQGF